MRALKMVVQGDKLVGEAPPGLAQGTVLELCLADPDDEMTSDELAKLNAFLEASIHSAAAGQTEDAEEVLGRLRAKRK